MKFIKYAKTFVRLRQKIDGDVLIFSTPPFFI